MTGEGEASAHNGSGEEVGTETPPVLADSTAGQASNEQSFGAIEAEGNEARWQAAKETALAVFNSPALVTPRRMSLLGEEGLAAFVDAVRSIARAYIHRERSRREEAPSQPSRPAGKRAPSKAQPRSARHQPAPFGIAQPKQLSVRERWMGQSGLLKGAMAIVSDVLFGSLIAAIAIAIAVLLYCFAPTLAQ